MLLIRFGLVGGSGVLVNLLSVIVANKIGPDENGVFWDPGFTDFNVRWYHVYSTIAFLVANLWNFQLNRSWAFRSAKHSGWLREYFPFLAVGLAGQVVGLGILTLLMHPGSFLSLSTRLFDDSSGLRTRLYWAQLITIAIVTPLSFVFNKIWTFSAVRGLGGPAGSAVVDPTVVDPPAVHPPGAHPFGVEPAGTDAPATTDLRQERREGHERG